MGALSEDRLKKLTDIGFNIHQGKKKAAAPFDPWHTRILELKAFKEAHGHTDVPRSYSLNHALALWTRNQRLAKIEGTLSEDQIKALEDVGFDFTAKSSRPFITAWDKKFAELAKYKAQNKSVKGIITANPDIGNWLERQKQICKEKGLEKSRFDRLKELGVTLTDGFISQPATVVPWQTTYEALVGMMLFVNDRFIRMLLMLPCSSKFTQSTKMTPAIQTCREGMPKIQDYTNGF